MLHVLSGRDQGDWGISSVSRQVCSAQLLHTLNMTIPESKPIHRATIQPTLHLNVFYFKMLGSKTQLFSGLNNVK